MADMSTIIADVQQRLQQHVRETLTQLTGDIIDLTPVKTGYLQSSWYFSDTAAPRAYRGNPRAGNDKTSTKNRVAQQIQQGLQPSVPAMVAVYNNTEYAPIIEAGRVGPGVGSLQAPNGMMRVNLLRFPLISDRVAQALNR